MVKFSVKILLRFDIILLKRSFRLFSFHVTITLREKCPNMELFLVRIFPYSDSYLSVFSPDAGKYGPEITPHLDTFHAVVINGDTLG